VPLSRVPDNPRPTLLREPSREPPDAAKVSGREHAVPAIHHIEMNVSDLVRSRAFYRRLLLALGWRELSPGMYLNDGCEIYLKAGTQAHAGAHYGPRHICLRASSREEVDQIGELLASENVPIIRGPQPMPEYSPAYYTVDFRDPDGFVLEVAHD
jgi:catechol 2,3-dioxygenase-like lactoylglutathione lyase family enzyme